MSFRSFQGALAASAVLLVPATAFAQSAAWSRVPMDTARYSNATEAQAPYYEARRTAYDQGYREGVRKGEQDGRRGDRFAYQNERDFQRGDKGYHRNLGDRDRYRQIFRDGYAVGYSDGYSRYGRNVGRQGTYGPQRPYGQQGPYSQQGGYGARRGGNYGGSGGSGYYSPAFDNGVREGYEKGREDRRKTRSYDPLRHGWYRSGDRHFESRYGSRDEYKNVYRRAFQQGYERGFREGRSRW